jgi:hypothetical protein
VNCKTGSKEPAFYTRQVNYSIVHSSSKKALSAKRAMSDIGSLTPVDNKSESKKGIVYKTTRCGPVVSAHDHQGMYIVAVGNTEGCNLLLVFLFH